MSDPWDKLDEQTRALLDGYGGEGVVVVRPSLVRALRGDGNGAILLSQLLYWCRRLGDGEGRFYQGQGRLEAQAGLGPDAQRKAVRLLERLGVLETTRRGVPARLYYRVDLPRLAALLLQHSHAVSVTGHGPKLDPEHSPQQDAGDGRPQVVGYGPQHIEIIKENLQEIKKKISPSPLQGAGTPPRSRGRQSTPKHPLPDDFTMTPAMRVWAAEHAPQVDLEHETRKLVAWAGAKGEWRSDWTATWRLWMVNAAKPGPRGQRGASSPTERHAGIRRWLDQKRGDKGASP